MSVEDGRPRPWADYFGDPESLDGEFWDMPEEAYHADPWLAVTGVRSLSSSVAKSLLPPSTPAHARHAMLNPKHSNAFDFGSAVHRAALTKGAALHVVDADSWRTNAAKAEREEARAAGRIPILAGDAPAVEAAAGVILGHPVAGPLLSQPGAPEVVLTWREDGLPCRAMLDYWPSPLLPAPVVVDVKTTAGDTDPFSLTRVVARFRYHVQDAFYRLGYYRVHGVWPAFVFVFVEVDPPHEVTVVELDDQARDQGDAAVERALRIWRDCTATDTWPGRPAGIELIGLPRWARDTEDSFA